MATNERNVVILGKVGSGKKTLGNRIAGKDIFQHESALGATNAGTHYKQHTKGDMLYQILTVDTEGLQTGYNDPIPYIRKTFSKIHLIIFVIANGRYTDESHRSLTIATKSLPPQAKSLCVLVITHCEGLTKEQLQGIVTEFKDDARTSQVTGLMEKGIFPVGFPDTSKLPPQLKQLYENGIVEDEKIIRQLVDGCTSSLDTEDLPIRRQCDADTVNRVSWRRYCNIF